MQTDRYDYTPIIRRKPFKWPNNARVALMVAPNIEFFHIHCPGSLLDFTPQLGTHCAHGSAPETGIRNGALPLYSAR